MAKTRAFLLVRFNPDGEVVRTQSPETEDHGRELLRLARLKSGEKAILSSVHFFDGPLQVAQRVGP